MSPMKIIVLVLNFLALIMYITFIVQALLEYRQREILEVVDEKDNNILLNELTFNGGYALIIVFILTLVLSI